MNDKKLAILSFDAPPIQDFEGYYFTHLKQDETRMGEEAIKLLLASIEDPTISQSIMIPVKLIEGRTT